MSRLKKITLTMKNCSSDPVASEASISSSEQAPETPNRWDDWVPQDRLRKLTDENRELAQNLKRELDATRRPPPKSASTSKRRAQGSDIGSGRGSEERHSSLPAGGRGTKRNRDYEIEKVGSFSSPGTVPTSPSAGRSKDTAPSLGPYFRPFLTGTGRGRYQVTQPSADGAALRPQRSRYFQDDTDNEPTWKKKKVCDMTAEEILSGLPPDPPDLVTKRWAPLLSGTVAECYGGPPDDTKPTPQPMQQVNQDPGNESRRLFFQDHKPGEVLMIAGRPYPQPLHPLHSPVNEPDNDNFVFTQEENFHSRPSVRIVVPDIIKAHLVDDWENVTKNLQLVPLPSQAPVNFIMDTYFDEEKGKRRLGSAEADLLEEVVAGVKEYFDLTLGRILLYRFEREQFSEIRKLWEGGDPKWEGKGPGDAYGAEHLSRLFGKFSSSKCCRGPRPGM